LSTGGNLAFPLTPPELNAGTAYRFSIYHIMSLDGPGEMTALFPLRTETTYRRRPHSPFVVDRPEKMMLGSVMQYSPRSWLMSCSVFHGKLMK
jgi:hypothetical protein